MQIQNSFSPMSIKRRLRPDILRSTVRTKNTPINFTILFEKYFIKEENQLNLKKYLIELYHELSHFSSKEDKGVSYETFIYFMNMPYPISSNIFKLLDKDKNNYLNIEEFVIGLYDIYGTNSLNKLSNFVFNLYDTDRNRLISKEDIHLILSYIPLDRNLRNKFLHRDYYNINYSDIIKNQKMIERTLNNIYHNRNFLNLENFIFTVQNTCSDILVAVLIYLYEARPFNNDVLKIYSNTDYDYLSENKNYQNFKLVEKFFEKNHKEKKISLINSESNLFELNQFIEEPTIDYIKDLNVLKSPMRSEQKKYTFAKQSISEDKKSKSNRNLELIMDKTKKKPRGSSFLPEIKMPRASINSKRMSSGFVLEFKYIDTDEKSIIHISDLLKLNSVYESTVFKITNKGKLKAYYLKLIKHDLFYFKSRDDKFHIGMHHLTNNVVLIKNEKQKYKSVIFYSLSIINQNEKHTFYFDKEDIFILWYKHLQKAILFRNIEDIFILGEKIKTEKMQILRNIQFREEMSNYYYHMNNNGIVDEEKKLICSQISKAGKNYQKKINESIFNQISSYQICYHKNFCKLIDIFQDEKYFYIITEKTSEINILQYIRKLDIHNPLKEEAKICEIVHQILIAIYYLHKMGIMHRNIKPDSLVPYIESRSHNESYSSSSINSESNSSSSYSKSSKTDNNNHDSNKFSNIKLIDLSLSKFININEKIKEPYGTVGYTSPEMLLEQSYDFKIDEWSIGIMTYLLLCGKLPFSDEYSEREIARQTIHEKQSFEQPKWEKISKEAKDFVNKLLIKDPKKRMKVKNALVHPWIKKYYPQIVIKRMKNINDNTTCEEGYEFESFSTPIDNINDLI